MEKSVENADDFGLASALKDCSVQLIDALKNDSNQEAARIINNLVQGRDEHVYTALGQLTRGLHNAIVNFNIEENSNVAFSKKEYLDICDTSDHLSAVMEMTEKSAHRTMDVIDESAPLAANLGREAEELRTELAILSQGKFGKPELHEAFSRIDDFLSRLCGVSKKLSTNMQNIVMEQGVQEFSGQVLKRVIALVKELEGNLVNLVSVASHMEMTPANGFPPDKKSYINSLLNKSPRQYPNNSERRQDSSSKKNKDISLQTYTDKKSDAHFDQDEVDDLLSSLGF